MKTKRKQNKKPVVSKIVEVPKLKSGDRVGRFRLNSSEGYRFDIDGIMSKRDIIEKMVKA